MGYINAPPATKNFTIVYMVSIVDSSSK